MELLWHAYRYHAYEKELAIREVKSLLPEIKIKESPLGLGLSGDVDYEMVKRLVYFSCFIGKDKKIPTLQSLLERSNGKAAKRQATRYSAHGLHEYKGKFNPQVVRAILNTLNIPVGSNILDPFCGSGTSLLECAHHGMRAVGTDVNPLAVFIANTKLKSINLDVDHLKNELTLVMEACKDLRKDYAFDNNARYEYMSSWFNEEILSTIEAVRTAINASNKDFSDTLLIIASNLLRDYSLQDPKDLRIRRRKTPLPEKDFLTAFEEETLKFCEKLKATQSLLDIKHSENKAILTDSRIVKISDLGENMGLFDCALTSPPYATALPYIDTQRLSLVWLGLLNPSEVHPLEAHLVGSREMRGSTKKALLQQIEDNYLNLPERQAKYCQELQECLTESDGFRRQAVPLLLYRYFSDMAKVFRSVRPLMKENATFALIVGGNHTTLSGKRFDINTPQHLAEIATSCGWHHIESIPLQTYQRYGYNMNNAVKTESLVILRAI